MCIPTGDAECARGCGGCEDAEDARMRRVRAFGESLFGKKLRKNS